MLKNYFLIAVRSLSRNKIFSAIHILGLSLGLASCMLIYLYTLDEISFDRFHQKGASIRRIVATFTLPTGETTKLGISGMMPGPSFQRSIPEIAAYARYHSTYPTIRHKQELFDQQAAYADESFFTIFSFPLLSGNPSKALSDVNALVLTESTAKKYFGRTDVIGEQLELKTDEKFEPFQVTAVMRDPPQNSSIRPQMLLSMKREVLKRNDKFWANFFLHTFILLKPGANEQQVVAQMNRVFLAEAKAELAGYRKEMGSDGNIHFGLQAMKDLHLSTTYQADNGLDNGSNPMYSYILSGIALLILVIACINFVNLTLGQALKRGREIGIRKAIGGQRKQLILQFLGEALVLCCIAFLLALGIVALVLPYFNTLANKALSFHYLLSWKLIAGYCFLLLATAFLAGFYPALVLSGFNPVLTLYGRTQSIGKNHLAKATVVFQFTLATFLLVAVITMYSQFHYLTNYNLGYNDKGVLTVNTGSMDKSRLDLFRNELLKNPGIRKVCADQGGYNATLARINHGTDIEFNFRYIDEHYFPLFDIPIVQGRNFSAAFPTDTAESVIVNESFVKKAGWKNPIGQDVDFFYRNKKYHVIGVIRDYHFESLTRALVPQLFTTDPSMQFGTVYVKTEPGSLGAAQAHLASVFKSFFPMKPYDLRYKDQENLQAYDAESKWKKMISMGAILTIIISSIGLLGLATLTAQRRVKEIGIRKVLGASVGEIVRMLSGDFLRMVVLSIIIAFPLAAWGISKWLQGYPYRVHLQWWMFGLAGMLVLSLAFLTISWQTLQAARNNPVNSLKSE